MQKPKVLFVEAKSTVHAQSIAFGIVPYGTLEKQEKQQCIYLLLNSVIQLEKLQRYLRLKAKTDTLTFRISFGGLKSIEWKTF